MRGVLASFSVLCVAHLHLLHRRPITSTSPASQFFGISQSVRYGASTKLLTNAPGIFDTGTTLVLLATGTHSPALFADLGFLTPDMVYPDVLAAYINAVGAVFDPTTQLYRITPAQYTNLNSLFFTINGVCIFRPLFHTLVLSTRTSQVVFEFTANAQIWPVRSCTSTNVLSRQSLTSTVYPCARTAYFQPRDWRG